MFCFSICVITKPISILTNLCMSRGVAKGGEVEREGESGWVEMICFSDKVMRSAKFVLDKSIDNTGQPTRLLKTLTLFRAILDFARALVNHYSPLCIRAGNSLTRLLFDNEDVCSDDDILEAKEFIITGCSCRLTYNSSYVQWRAETSGCPRPSSLKFLDWIPPPSAQSPTHMYLTIHIFR